MVGKTSLPFILPAENFKQKVSNFSSAEVLNLKLHSFIYDLATFLQNKTDIPDIFGLKMHRKLLRMSHSSMA